MNNRFFHLSVKQQYVFQLKLVSIFLAFNVAIGILLYWLGLPLIIFLFIGFSLTLLAPFIDVPSAINAGRLNYYSALLLGERVRNNCLVLHSGSLFDYYFVLDKSSSAKQRRSMVFINYIEGLLELIKQYEEQSVVDVKVQVTSYIFNARTLQRLGFRQTSTNIFQWLILYLNVFNLVACLYLLNGKFSWPRLGQLASYEVELSDLIAKKPILVALKQRYEY